MVGATVTAMRVFTSYSLRVMPRDYRSRGMPDTLIWRIKQLAGQDKGIVTAYPFDELQGMAKAAPLQNIQNRGPMLERSDAFVFFGATGDLAYKKIFPALQSMVRRGTLDVPVIGVAKSGWTVEQLRERARDSIAKHGGGVDETLLRSYASCSATSTATTGTTRPTPRCAA